MLVPYSVSSGPISLQVAGLTAQSPWFYLSTQVQLTDSLGNQTSYAAEINGGQWFLTNSIGSGCSTCTIRGNVSQTPDANGNVLTSTDALSNTTTYTYDASSNVASISKP